MPFSVGARDVGCFVWVRKTDGVLKQRLPQEAEAFPTQNPPQPPRDQHKPTATEYIDNHSSILICPLDILFAKKGPRRGASAQKSTQHYWTSQGSHKGLSIDAGGAEGWHRSKSLAWGGGQRRWRRGRGWRGMKHLKYKMCCGEGWESLCKGKQDGEHEWMVW